MEEDAESAWRKDTMEENAESAWRKDTMEEDAESAWRKDTMEENAESAWRKDTMEENTESAWRSAQKAGPSSGHVTPDVSSCHQEAPKECHFAHVGPISSRDKNVAPGVSCSSCLVPALLMALLLMCATLQSVLVFLRVSGIREDGFVTRNFSDLQNSLSKEEWEKWLEFLLVTNHTKQGKSPRCPDLWISIYDKCYFFSENQKHHEDGIKDCAERGSRLALVKEKTLRRLVTITGKKFWIGLTQYNTQGAVWAGRWADGTTENVTEGTGSCANLGSHFTWENCYTALSWICEREAV
ncbi:killer cell lectin-like receptor subfamily B member 1B allele C [Rana temporaria]|uniref:killer cell lectin-like receptor subfamily B member 1B allele C n=1 Tax=Rana temporaria TaxID=8407 RepID=UPI001AACB666|nr:killer cell lectin-like receptor subfamily B member 1B allele C [Rana temporaria]XP_040191676.1 killer cell lectin-like receptor subfamily B member 1B allele C [Rana temporaria]